MLAPLVVHESVQHWQNRTEGWQRCRQFGNLGSATDAQGSHNSDCGFTVCWKARDSYQGIASAILRSPKSDTPLEADIEFWRNACPKPPRSGPHCMEQFRPQV